MTGSEERDTAVRGMSDICGRKPGEASSARGPPLKHSVQPLGSPDTQPDLD